MNLMKRPRRGRRRFLRGAEGMSAVEMALVLPALLLVISGIFDFGNLYSQKNLVASAAGDGARIAAISTRGAPATPTTQSALQTIIRTDYDNDNLTVTMTPGTPTSGSPVTVTVSLAVPIMTPGVNTIFTSLSIPVPVTVSGRSVMMAQ